MDRFSISYLQVENARYFRDFDYALNSLARNCPKIEEFDIKRLCNPNIPDKFFESVEVAKWMIKHGAPLDSQDRYNN